MDRATAKRLIAIELAKINIRPWRYYNWEQKFNYLKVDVRVAYAEIFYTCIVHPNGEVEYYLR